MEPRIKTSIVLALLATVFAIECESCVIAATPFMAHAIAKEVSKPYAAQGYNIIIPEVGEVPKFYKAREESKRDKWHKVPQLDGTIKMMSNEEIEAMTEIHTDSFDAEKEIVYYLYTGYYGSAPTILKFENKESLQNSNYNDKYDTIFLIHGWQANHNSDVIKKLAAAYLQKGSFNIIGVDWSAGSGNMLYPVSKARVYEVGPMVARMIAFLINNSNSRMAQFTVVGHSLGGQTAGLVGKKTNGTLPTIIALDPAGPLFYMDDPPNRLTPGDAGYVEVIHTSNGLGFFAPIGQNDFYPNGGHDQPGCWYFGSCSHSRSVDYFIESINSNVLMGSKCHSFDEIKRQECAKGGEVLKMGGYPSNSGTGRGNYYLRTGEWSPYGLGWSGVS